MTNRQVLAIGCGAVALLFVGAIVAAFVFLWHVSQDPADVWVSVEGPPSVVVGEEFTLSVVVENQRQGDSFRLSDIDVAEAYLDGFLILGTEPGARSSMHVPIDDTRSFHFDVRIPARATRRFDFRLRPVDSGIFRGDVDVCEGARFLSTLAQTEVRSDS